MKLQTMLLVPSISVSLSLPLSPPSLRDLAAEHGVFMGAAANEREMSSQSPDVGTYKQTLAREYSLITAQNSCKWSPTEPGDGQYDFAACDFLMTW